MNPAATDSTDQATLVRELDDALVQALRHASNFAGKIQINRARSLLVQLKPPTDG